MAWVKIKNTTGDIIQVPETVYETMFANNEGFSLVKDEPKPSPVLEEKIKKTEVVKDNVQEHKSDETNIVRKSTKKTN